MVKYETFYSQTLNSYLVKVWSPVFKGGQVVLNPDQFLRFKAWANGSGNIQTVLHDLSPDDREILMTGCGPKEWDEMFKGGKDEA